MSNLIKLYEKTVFLKRFFSSSDIKYSKTSNHYYIQTEQHIKLGEIIKFVRRKEEKSFHERIESYLPDLPLSEVGIGINKMLQVMPDFFQQTILITSFPSPSFAKYCELISYTTAIHPYGENNVFFLTIPDLFPLTHKEIDTILSVYIEVFKEKVNEELYELLTTLEENRN